MTPRKKTAQRKVSKKKKTTAKKVSRPRKKTASAKTKKKKTKKKAAKKKTATRKKAPKKTVPRKKRSSPVKRKSRPGIIREKGRPTKVIRPVRYAVSSAEGSKQPAHPQEYLPLSKGFVRRWQEIASQMPQEETLPVGPRELFLKIQLQAYYLYLERGAGHGNDWADWFRAEQEILDLLELENVGLN